jgi:hypothetical protein
MLKLAATNNLGKMARASLQQRKAWPKGWLGEGCPQLERR